MPKIAQCEDACDATAGDFLIIASNCFASQGFEHVQNLFAIMAENFVCTQGAKEKIMEMWQDMPTLFDLKLPAYHNRVTKDVLLTKMSREIGCNSK